jgi:UPF0755 protein
MSVSQSGSKPKPDGPKRRRRPRRLLRLFGLLGLLGLLAAGGAYGWYCWAKGPLDPAAEPVDFRVPKGAAASVVGEQLAAAGLLRSELAWKIHFRLAAPPAPKAGLHRVSAAMDVPTLAAALAAQPLAEEIEVTLIEGWRLRDADAALAAAGLIEPGAYIEAANQPERFRVPFALQADSLAGYLLPDTYRVPAPDGELAVDRLIQTQLDAFWKRFAEPRADAIAASGRSLHQIVIMASLLEREEPKPEVRPKVAGVLYKRLDSNTPLGVDATSRFTLDNWNDRRAFLRRLRDPDDPYNTRLRRGLPPGPIGAPSLASLEAALQPEKSPYWYYLHDEQQNIHFARNAQEHEANRRRYDVW